VLFGAVFLAAAADAAVAYQLTAAHNARVTLKGGFAPPLTRLWVRDLGGPVSYPLIAKGKVFVSVANTVGNGTQLYALRTSTGETVWHKLVGGRSNLANIAYDRGQVFVLNVDGLLEAADADTGKLAWAQFLYGQTFFSAAPVAHGGAIYAAGYGVGGTLYKVREFNGDIAWSVIMQAGDVSSPAVWEQGVYVTYTCDYYRFNTVTGLLDWHYQVGCENGGGKTPVFANGKLYVRDLHYGNVILDAATGTLIGSFKSGTPPVLFVDSGTEYMIAFAGGTVQCVNMSSGSLLWSFSGDGKLNSNPIVINGYVVVGSGSGQLYMLDRLDGSIAWSTDVGAPIRGSGEGANNAPWTGLGIATGRTLFVPASNQISAYVPQN
jgi:outer membrane protein assembly factor BamB